MRPELVMGYSEMKIGEHHREKKDDTKAEVDPSLDTKLLEDKKNDKKDLVNATEAKKKKPLEKKPSNLEKKEPKGIPTLVKAEDKCIRSLL